MKKLVAIVLSMAMLFSFAACGANEELVETKTLPVSLASEPESIDPALNSTVDGSTLIVHAFAGLAGYKTPAELNCPPTAPKNLSSPPKAKTEPTLMFMSLKITSNGLTVHL